MFRNLIVFRKLLVFVWLLCFDAQLFAQADFRMGYLVNNDWDTVPGWIDYRGDSKNMELCIFRQDSTSVPVSLNAKQIKGYRFVDEGRYFVSRYIKTESVCDTVFLEYLVNGISDLYYYQNNRLYSAYFIESPTGELLEVRALPETKEVLDGVQYTKKDYSYYGALNYALGDCERIRDDLQFVELNHKSLIKIVSKYHEYKCTDQACIVYQKSIQPIKVWMSPFVGYAASTVKFLEDGEFDKYDFHWSHSLALGINGEFWLPRMNERLKIVLGLVFNRDYFFGTHQERISDNANSGMIYNDCHLNRTNLRADFSLKYTSPQGCYRPFVLGGIFAKAVLSEDCKIVQEVKYNDVVTIDQYQSKTAQRTIVGLTGGVGVQTQIFDKSDLFVLLSYSYGSTMLGGYGNIERNNTVALVAGLSF